MWKDPTKCAQNQMPARVRARRAMLSETDELASPRTWQKLNLHAKLVPSGEGRLGRLLPCDTAKAACWAE